MRPHHLLPANLRDWTPELHKWCRTLHRFFVSTRVMLDFQFLRFWRPYFSLTPMDEVGTVWIGVCLKKGTNIKIQLGNRFFHYRLPYLANYFEVIAANDLAASHLAIVLTTSQFAEALYLKFTLDQGFIEARCQHLMHPGSRRHEGMMRIVPIHPHG